MSLTDPLVFARGAAYRLEGRVEEVDRGEGRVTAVVRGSLPYDVELRVEGGRPWWSCSCPAAEDGSFCKHCVAVALTLDGTDPSAATETGVGATGSSGDIEEWVAGLDHDRLVGLVLEAADGDWRLGERLRAEAAAASGGGPDLGLWRRRIDGAFAPYDDFVSYREAAGWTGGVDELIDALDDLCGAGHPDAVIGLVQHAHRRADEAMQYVDDSDGWLFGISQRLGDLHLRACSEGSPDPVELARRLVGLELTSELDAFHRAAADYADVLGDRGLVEYRRLVEPRWRELPPEDEHRWSSERFAVREAMIGVALASGDPDQLIEVRRGDLRIPDDYLEVARSLADAGRTDEAVDWARRGLDDHPERAWQSAPLREFLAGLLRDRGDRAGAVELFWDAFERSPSLGSYRALLAEAGGDAATWRRRAIGRLRERVAEPAPSDDLRRSFGSPTVAQALIDILCHEGQVDEAWEAASRHGCDDRMWMTLARAREADHPLDAIAVYERQVFQQIDRKKNGGYRAAVDLMARIRRLADTAGEPVRFAAVLGRVRTEHKAKRNLKALLDAKGW